MIQFITNLFTKSEIKIDSEQNSALLACLANIH